MSARRDAPTRPGRRSQTGDAAGETRLGKYRVLEEAGRGGMATVYRGQTIGARGFQRPVAIKRILRSLSTDDRFVAMLVEEARVASAILHPNVVQVHDFDEDDTGGYFLVMEWVEGMTLFDWCRIQKQSKALPPWPLLAAIGIEALRGLRAAHEHIDDRGLNVPIFHRDVSAQNILLSEQGYVKLSDFGIARAMDRARVTDPGVVKGKLSHVAPELVDGQEVSRQSDLYSVGLVLWQALAGRKLFRGKDALEILKAVRRAEIPPLAELRPDVPTALIDVLHHALAKDPAERFRTARHMIHELSDILRLEARTDSERIAQSVHEARQRAARRVEVPSIAQPPVLLTQRK